MEIGVTQEFETALREGKDSLALSIIDNYDQRTFRLLWHLRELPPNLATPDDSLAKLLDNSTWMRFSKQLHQRVPIEVFTWTSVIFMGSLVLLWGVLEASSIIQSGKDYLAELSSFCLIPSGIIFLLGGGFMLFHTIKWVQKMQPPLKKKD